MEMYESIIDCNIYYTIRGQAVVHYVNDWIVSIEDITEYVRELEEKRNDGMDIAHYEGNHRYLFPFYDWGKATGLYTLVTHFKDGQVVEEYFISRGQIVYESYDYSRNDKVGYYYINYVPTGKYPLLGESKGYFLPDFLEYVEEESYAWYQELQ